MQIGAYTFETVRQEDGTYVSSVVEGPLSEKSAETLDNGTLLATFPSASGNDPHYVRYSKGLGVYCSCIGYGYRHECRYTKLINQLLDEKETTLEALAKQPISIKEI